MSAVASQFLAKRGFYQGGKRTVANRDFWNGTADFETLAAPDRNTMRARARWLHENNPIMSNIDTSIINNVIGTGITLDYNINNKRIDKVVNKAWKAWCHKNKCDVTKRLSFSDIQRATLQSRMVDGEIFIQKIVTPEGLKLRLLESDGLDDGEDGGVEKNSDGSVRAYRFLTEDRKTITVLAEDMVNYYRSERPSQYRGVSEYKQAITDIKNFSAFQTATVEGARARANIGYIVESDAGANAFGGTTDPSTDQKIQEITGVAVQYLKQGEKIIKLDPSNAGSDFASFSESVIRLIATARKVSYELAYKDFSKVNYSSSRASLLQDYKRFDYEQSHLQEYFLDEIFEAWLDIEVMAGRVKIPQAKYFNDKTEFLDATWVYPKRDWVDPLKDIIALEKEIALGITTATDVTASRGGDYEKNMAKKKQELDIQEKYDVYDEMHSSDNTEALEMEENDGKSKSETD